MPEVTQGNGRRSGRIVLAVCTSLCAALTFIGLANSFSTQQPGGHGNWLAVGLIALAGVVMRVLGLRYPRVLLLRILTVVCTFVALVYFLVLLTAS